MADPVITRLLHKYTIGADVILTFRGVNFDQATTEVTSLQDLSANGNYAWEGPFGTRVLSPTKLKVWVVPRRKRDLDPTYVEKPEPLDVRGIGNLTVTVRNRTTGVAATTDLGDVDYEG